MPQAAAREPASKPSPAEMANAVRVLAMDAVEAAKSGHPGMPMGMADVALVLWSKFLKFDASNPTWPDRDRFILSAGHGSMLLYAVNYLCGYEKVTIEQIRKFRQLHALTAGHPEVMQDAGIETTTGPLGQGLGNAVGFALGERILNARFGDELVDHHTYVIASDGDMMEGVSHEAASLAGHLKLSRLIVLYDDNSISIDGATNLSFSDDTLKRFEAYGWHVLKVDGHDSDAVEKAILAAKTDPRPSLITCKTVIGFGAPKKAGTKDCHGSPLGAEEIAATRAKLGWNHPPFEVPAAILNEWRSYGSRGNGECESWKKRHQSSSKRAEFNNAMEGKINAEAFTALEELKIKAAAEKPKVATRQSSGMVLEALLPHIPELVGGSADLTPSNNTYVKGFENIAPPSYNGRYVRYGVREHGMAACMNGMALHGGIIPYAGTFLQFTDYCRPSIRLAALMKQRVIYVMTHDSIGLGEDGPTHQPVEHLAALRAMPNLYVLRPCDTVEAAECWEMALKRKAGPSVLALSRQNLPTLRKASAENLSSKGAYILAGGENRRATILATGSEVSIAMEAHEKLKAEGIETAVVSIPGMKQFDLQDDAYRQSVLGKAPRLGIEAGVRIGWSRYLRMGQDKFLGMKDFGESAPAGDLYKHFGITADAAVTIVKQLIS